MRLFGDDSNTQKVEMLKKVSVFRELSRREILEVDELLHERTYGKDEIIFEQGDAGHGIFIIISGKVRVKSTCRLLETVVPELGPGEILGELSLFEEAPRDATVVAIEPTIAVALFQAEFSSLLTRNKSIGVKVLMEILRIMSSRVRRLLSDQPDLPGI
jgi:CRP/FNR family cyclic AMP-dependent transcriptional regulator